MGDGGGCCSPRGDRAADVSIEEGDWGDVGDMGGLAASVRPERDMLDLIDPASDFSYGPSPLARRVELRGLSVFPLEPGILDRNDRKDRVESLVSDLWNEG